MPVLYSIKWQIKIFFTGKLNVDTGHASWFMCSPAWLCVQRHTAKMLNPRVKVQPAAHSTGLKSPIPL
jgi:hypothetical protein